MHIQFSGMAVASLTTEALRKLKRDGTVQAWGQKTLRVIKQRENMGQCKSKERGFKQGFKEQQGVSPLKNRDREKKQ
jgi:hypothetical protein